MNRVFAITANRIGTEGNLTFTGMSTIASTKGDVLYQAKADTEELKIVEIDLLDSHNKLMTPRNDIFADRRVEFFQEILKK
jgi:predicted amidohydrolase